MMHYNRYDFVFTKSSKLYLADTLSIAHLDSNEGNQDERARIMNINTFGGIPEDGTLVRRETFRFPLRLSLFIEE